MKHSDKDLRMYAANGLRSLDDWASLGRDVPTGAAPRTDAMIRGKSVALFGRDQTVRRQRPPTGAPVALSPAAVEGAAAQS
jgi:hypothetical protein